MGHVWVKIRVSNPGKKKYADVAAIVDTGAWITVEGKEEQFRVWVSDVIDKTLLGVIVLEEFGFQVDPTTGKLKKEPLMMY